MYYESSAYTTKQRFQMKIVIRSIKLFEMRFCRQILTRSSVQKYCSLAVLLLG